LMLAWFIGSHSYNCCHCSLLTACYSVWTSKENMLILDLVVLYYPPSGVYNIAVFRLNMKMRKGKGI